MNWLTNIKFLLVSLLGGYVGAVISGELPVLPKRPALSAKASSASPKIVRFSKKYACQSHDKACIFNGIQQFQAPEKKTGLLN